MMTQEGVYVGNNPADVETFSTYVGRKQDNFLAFLNQTSWSAFDSSIPYIRNLYQGVNAKMILSVPLTVTGSSLEQAAAGDFNDHYLAAANMLAASQRDGGPIYVRLGWEFNLPGSTWSAKDHESAFIKAFQNAADTFRSVSSRFKFVWDVNIGGGNIDPASAYPGDRYVDVVGADSYYSRQYDSSDAQAAFNTKVSEQYGLQWQQDFAAAHGKATAISEWGVDTDSGGPYIRGISKWMQNHNMLYENYWNSNAAFAGDLSSDQYPQAGEAFKSAFGPLGLAATPPSVVCFAAGTLIRSARFGRISDIPIQDLAIGDIAVTAYGANRPIRWIGHRSYSGRFAKMNPTLLPICVKAGAIAEDVPARDLWVSAKHALYIDGVLIPAAELVNGVSIAQVESVNSIEYWHIELESHDLILAENTPAESFINDKGRDIFHNAQTFHVHYPNAVETEAIYCAPRLESGYVVAAVRRRLAERAGLRDAPATLFGALLGQIDTCEGRVAAG